MILIYNNQSLDATITATTEDGNYPVSNLNDPIAATRYRSTSASSQRITFAKSATQINYICIIGHNLTINTTLKIQGNNSDSWSDPEFSETIPASCYYGGKIIYCIEPDDIDSVGALYGDELYGDELYGSTSEALPYRQYDYWSLSITDSSLSYIELGVVYLSKYFTVPGIEEGAGFNRNTTSITTFSSSGQAYGDIGYQYRTNDFNLPLVTEANRQIINAIWDAVENVYPIVVLIWEEELQDEYPLYCVIELSGLAWEKKISIFKPWEVPLRLREVF